ncbi:MAG: PIN domain-containing protein [Limnochordaceae bacterium]|nr:PIN domain-containing protein [Limnochordaceae bacterium]
MILLDTNVLVYAINADVPQHPASRAVLESALRRQLPAILVPQVLLEFYAVITCPRRVEHPLDPETAWNEVTALRASIPVLPVISDTLDALGRFVSERKVAGQHIFDLFLAAQMRAHRIDTICTYDRAAFEGIPGVVVATPEQLLPA